jgi:hypothetical protein
MRRYVFIASLIVAGLILSDPANVSLGAGAQVQSNPPLLPLESQRNLVAQYCAGCHNDQLKSGGFSWSAIDLERPFENLRQAEKVIRKLVSGMMPPPGAKRPDLPSTKAFAAALETRIDQAAMSHPAVRSPELHRMNRTEYQNAVKDLLGIHVDVGELLPPDARTSSGVAGGGFDNMSEALTITPVLLSAYVNAAEKISRDAIGDPKATTAMRTYKVSRLINQMHHIAGTPEGTRGGVSVLHTFPADGEYTFKATFFYYYMPEVMVGAALPTELQGQQLEISIDGERVAVLDLDPKVVETKANHVTQPVKVKAGQRRLAAAFIAKFDGPVQDHNRLVENTIMDTTISMMPEYTGLPHLESLAVTGPSNATGVSDNASRARIFSCRPVSPPDDERCATQILSGLASQAFRRPATPEDLESLMDFYKRGRMDGGFEEGIRAGLQAILAKPEFVFRFEKRWPDAVADHIFKISDLELASRLAYFLWSTIPDEQLTKLASQGKLSDPAILEQQVKRMLADARSEALATNFASQWLRLTGLKDAAPESLLFPDFTRQLGNSMRHEIELLFENIMREDRSVLELLTADYTFVDSTLARHYGIPNIVGSDFKRVQVTDQNRFGLLGKAGFLTATSPANRTSPVARGKYVLEVLMGSSPPLPPPVVPPFPERRNNQKVLTVRERMELHRANPACASCHRIMDPIGLSLENFDAVGIWRAREGEGKIDPSGEMYDGTKLDGPVSLRQAVLRRSDAFLRAFSENLLSYGLGRVVDYRDMTTVRQITSEAARVDNRFSAFILAVVKSPAFMMRSTGSTVQ